MKKVMILEDVVSLAKVYSLALEDNGYRVDTAHNGLEGLELLDEGFLYDAIISDCQMPMMKGLEFVDAIRDRDILTPVLIHTSDPKNLFIPMYPNLEVQVKEMSFDYLLNFLDRIIDGKLHNGERYGR